MSEELLSVFDIASRLNLHVRTVRNYIREGRLKAMRIGKQYRISRADLEAFTGQPLPPSDSARARRHRVVEACCIVDVDAVSPEAHAALEEALRAHPGADGSASPMTRVELLYEPAIGRMKVIVLGGLAASTSVLTFVDAFLRRAP